MYTKPQTVNLGFNREAFNAAVKDAVLEAFKTERNKVSFDYLERKLENGRTFTRTDKWELHIINASEKAWKLKCLAMGEWKEAE